MSSIKKNYNPFFPVALKSNAKHGLLIVEVSRSHTTTYHSRQDSSGRVISSTQRPLPDNTQHSEQKKKKSMSPAEFELTILTYLFMLMLSSHLHLGLQMVSFLHDSPHKSCTHEIVTTCLYTQM